MYLTMVHGSIKNKVNSRNSKAIIIPNIPQQYLYISLHILVWRLHPNLEDM